MNHSDFDLDQMAATIVVRGKRYAEEIDRHLRDDSTAGEPEQLVRSLDDRDLFAVGCYAVMKNLTLVLITTSHEEGRRQGLHEATSG